MEDLNINKFAEDFKLQYIAFCPECLGLRNKSKELPLLEISNIDEEISKHQCSCNKPLICDISLPPVITNSVIGAINKQQSLPDEFYNIEMLYPGFNDIDFVTSINDFVNDCFEANADKTTMELVVDAQTQLPMVIFECTNPITKVREVETGMLSMIALSLLFRKCPGFLEILEQPAHKIMWMLGDFFQNNEIDARNKVLYLTEDIK